MNRADGVLWHFGPTHDRPGDLLFVLFLLLDLPGEYLDYLYEEGE